MTNKEYLGSVDPSEWYDIVYCLFFKYGKQFIDTRLAIIDWLDKERKPVKPINGNMYSFCPHCYNVITDYIKECPFCHTQFE